MSIHPQWLAKAETSVHYGTSSTISIKARRVVDWARESLNLQEPTAYTKISKENFITSIF